MYTEPNTQKNPVDTTKSPVYTPKKPVFMTSSHETECDVERA